MAVGAHAHPMRRPSIGFGVLVVALAMLLPPATPMAAAPAPAADVTGATAPAGSGGSFDPLWYARAGMPGGSGGPVFVGREPRGATPAQPGTAAEAAIAFALAQRGQPYVWGGNGPQNGDGGFDCSGLTTAAYRYAGVGLPRTAHTQFFAGPHVPPGGDLMPGDLVFYGVPERIHHVGLYLGEGRMINAPTFGRPVQVALVRYAGDDFLGATRPAAGRDAEGLLGTDALPYPVPPVPAPQSPRGPDEFAAPAAPDQAAAAPAPGAAAAPAGATPAPGATGTPAPAAGATPTGPTPAGATPAPSATPTPSRSPGLLGGVFGGG